MHFRAKMLLTATFYRHRKQPAMLQSLVKLWQKSYTARTCRSVSTTYFVATNLVGGVFDSFTSNSFSLTSDLNRAIFIPYSTAKSISSNSAHIYQILVEPKDSVSQAASEVESSLTTTHSGQKDFAVLTQEETMQVAGRTPPHFFYSRDCCHFFDCGRHWHYEYYVCRRHRTNEGDRGA